MMNAWDEIYQIQIKEKGFHEEIVEKPKKVSQEMEKEGASSEVGSIIRSKSVVSLEDRQNE